MIGMRPRPLDMKDKLWQPTLPGFAGSVGTRGAHQSCVRKAYSPPNRAHPARFHSAFNRKAGILSGVVMRIKRR